MFALSKGKGAASSPNQTAPLQITSQLALDEPLKPNGDDGRLQAMRLQFALAGLSVSTAPDGGYIVTGRGLCLMADTRTAWLLLRSLTGRRP